MRSRVILGTVLVGALLVAGACRRDAPSARAAEAEILLPAPRTQGTASLEDALARRRSTRDFAAQPLTRGELSQLLWAAQGVTERTQGLRAAPSAGALYPLLVYVVSSDGVHRYEPRAHALRAVAPADRRGALAKASLDQAPVRAAPVSLVIVGLVDRTRAKYGARAERFVAMEAGHAAQNVLLQATALGLAAVPIGALDEEGVRAVVGEGAAATPLYVVPVGRRSP